MIKILIIKRHKDNHILCIISITINKSKCTDTHQNIYSKVKNNIDI